MDLAWIALVFSSMLFAGGCFIVFRSQHILSKRVFVLEKIAFGDHKEAFPDWCHRAADEDGKGPYVDDRAWPEGKGASGSVYRDPAVVEGEVFDGFVLIKMNKKGERTVATPLMSLEQAFIRRASEMKMKDEDPRLFKHEPDFVVHSAHVIIGKPTKLGVT